MAHESRSQSQQAKPVIVISPGSFSLPIQYAVFNDHLQHLGWESVHIPLPSIGRRDPLPPATMLDDAEVISKTLRKVIGDSNRVVLVTHSYGGTPATQGLKGMTVKERAADGKGGGVERVIYITSVVPPIDGSLQSEFSGGDSEVSYLEVHEVSNPPLPR